MSSVALWLHFILPFFSMIKGTVVAWLSWSTKSVWRLYVPTVCWVDCTSSWFFYAQFSVFPSLVPLSVICNNHCTSVRRIIHHPVEKKYRIQASFSVLNSCIAQSCLYDFQEQIQLSLCASGLGFFGGFCSSLLAPTLPHRRFIRLSWNWGGALSFYPTLAEPGV